MSIVEFTNTMYSEWQSINQTYHRNPNKPLPDVGKYNTVERIYLRTGACIEATNITSDDRRLLYTIATNYEDNMKESEAKLHTANRIIMKYKLGETINRDLAGDIMRYL